LLRCRCRCAACTRGRAKARCCRTTGHRLVGKRRAGIVHDGALRRASACPRRFWGRVAPSSSPQPRPWPTPRQDCVPTWSCRPLPDRSSTTHPQTARRARLPAHAPAPTASQNRRGHALARRSGAVVYDASSVCQRDDGPVVRQHRRLRPAGEYTLRIDIYSGSNYSVSRSRWSTARQRVEARSNGGFPQGSGLIRFRPGGP